jgi:putative transport protein
VFIEGIRSDGQILEFGPDTVLQAGDVVAVSGRREVLVNMLQTATEVEDRELLDIPAEAVDVVVTNKAIARKTLIDLAREEFARGVYLTKITRGAMSVDIPVLPQTQVYRVTF